MTVKPLDGIKVLDFTAFEAGTMCTETLAWLGAEVWKVERPVKGELGRYSLAKPGYDTVGFRVLNMNKESITCNLKKPEGIELMKKLLTQVDVMVENMGPGSIEGLGLGYDVCKEINPRLVYTQIKGFDMGGRGRDYPAFNPIAVAMGGMAAVNGEAGGPPMQCGVNVADNASGMVGALSILAALMQRDRSGEGQRLEIDMQDIVIGLGRSNWEPYYNNNCTPPRRVGSGMPMEDVDPCNLFPCKPFGPNDYVHIYCSRHPGSKNFESLCKIIGHEELLDDPDMATPRLRFQHRDKLYPCIEEWTAKHTKVEAMEILCKEGDIPAGAVLDVDDITKDDRFVETGTMVEQEYYGQPVRFPGFPVKMSGYKVDYKQAPELGCANDGVYGGVLGLSADEMAALKEKGVI